METAEDQIHAFACAPRCANGKLRPGGSRPPLVEHTDARILNDAICSRKLGSDEILKQLEAVGLDSKYLAGQIKKNLDNPKCTAKDRRMHIAQIIKIIEQSEGKKVVVTPGAQDEETLNKELVALENSIATSLGVPVERLRLAYGGDAGTSDSESSGTESAARGPEGRGAGDLRAASEG